MRGNHFGKWREEEVDYWGQSIFFSNKIYYNPAVIRVVICQKIARIGNNIS